MLPSSVSKTLIVYLINHQFLTVYYFFCLFEVCLYIWILSFSLTCHTGRTSRFLTLYYSHCSFALSPCMCAWEFCRVVIMNPVQFSGPPPHFFVIFWLCHVACSLTRDQTKASLRWKYGVLTTGLPGKLPAPSFNAAPYNPEIKFIDNTQSTSFLKIPSMFSLYYKRKLHVV